MTPRDLIREYPWMDEMLAETLIKAHQNGTLAGYVDKFNQPKQAAHSEVIVGAIEVLPPPEEKSVADSIG